MPLACYHDYKVDDVFATIHCVVVSLLYSLSLIIMIMLLSTVVVVIVEEPTKFIL